MSFPEIYFTNSELVIIEYSFSEIMHGSLQERAIEYVTLFGVHYEPLRFARESLWHSLVCECTNNLCRSAVGMSDLCTCMVRLIDTDKCRCPYITDGFLSCSRGKRSEHTLSFAICGYNQCNICLLHLFIINNYIYCQIK